MKIGTKSLLFGVHQFLWHPLTVWIAWIKLYRKPPSFKEAVCIFVHDWGYWGCADMDGEEGQRHPIWAGHEMWAILDRCNGTKWRDFCRYHSRHLAKKENEEPSALCWADKLSIAFEPWWWYLLRARLSGEIKEYRKNSAACGFMPEDRPDREWFRAIVEFMRKQAYEQKSSEIYMTGCDIASKPDKTTIQYLSKEQYGEDEPEKVMPIEEVYKLLGIDAEKFKSVLTMATKAFQVFHNQIIETANSIINLHKKFNVKERVQKRIWYNQARRNRTKKNRRGYR